jgi:hypothetical protein
MKPKKKEPNWTDLKRKLVNLDKAELIALIKELRAADKANQNFLNTRFQLGENSMEPYKATIKRCVSPSLSSNQPISITRAKKAISDYRKAGGKPPEVAELCVYYCEVCADFLSWCGMEDDSYFNALIREYAQALEIIAKLETHQQEAFLDRLDEVQHKAIAWGWGMSDAMLELRFKFDCEQT